jgi:hypothetical protein
MIEVPRNWFPKGAEIFDMVSYNNCIYVFFTPHDPDNLGFWCAKLQNTSKGWKWTLIVGDMKKGAKYPPGVTRMSNAAATPFVFKDKVYVGTLNSVAFLLLGGFEVDLNALMDLYPGSQMFRFDKNDKWERIMPSSNVKNPAEEAALSGFANPFNLYVWRFSAQGDRLYAGTFDSHTAIRVIAPFYNIPPIEIPWNPLGFDLYSTTDGKNWRTESTDGFRDPWNYGARTLVTDPKTGDLYLGTANPFYGCQLWEKPKK